MLRRLSIWAVVSCLAIAALPLGAIAAEPSGPPAVTVVDTPEGGQAMFARTDAKGTIHLTFQASDGPRYAWSDDHGKSFHKSLPLVDREARKPGLEYLVWDMAVDGEGRVHVALGTNAWKLKLPHEEWGYFYTRREPQAASFTPVQNLNRKPSEGFSLAADDQGRVTACWLADKLYVNVSHDRGATFGPNTELDAKFDPCNCCTTSIAYRADGKLGILYREETQNQRDMHLVLWDQEPNRVERSRISQTPWVVDACPMTYYALVPSGDGFVAVWPTKGQIYFTRLDGAATTSPLVETQVPGKSGMRTGILALSDPAGGTLIVWKLDDRLHWLAYNARGQAQGVPKSAASPGKGAAGVRTSDGKFVLFR